jgi:UDP-glucose 4-epimerase
VQALTRAAEVPEISGRVYNVGTGNTATILDLVAALNRILRTNLEPVFTPPRTGDVRFSKADIRRTREELGFDPLVGFHEGLERTVEWYADQKEQMVDNQRQHRLQRRPN